MQASGLHDLLAFCLSGSSFAGVGGRTISSQVQIKKNTENAGIRGFPEPIVGCAISAVPVIRAGLSRKRSGSRR
jgi:hypothetical protein